MEGWACSELELIANAGESTLQTIVYEKQAMYDVNPKFLVATDIQFVCRNHSTRSVPIGRIELLLCTQARSRLDPNGGWLAKFQWMIWICHHVVPSCRLGNWKAGMKYQHWATGHGLQHQRCPGWHYCCWCLLGQLSEKFRLFVPTKHSTWGSCRWTPELKFHMLAIQ